MKKWKAEKVLLFIKYEEQLKKDKLVLIENVEFL